DYIRNESHAVNVKGFSTDATGFKDVSLGSTFTASNSFTTSKLMSYVGRIHYVWKNKYIFTATGRYDGSSKFRKGHRFGFFPSGSIGWRLKNEKFMKNINFINQFKIRVGYGATGSQAIGPLATRAKLVTGNGVNYPI